MFKVPWLMGCAYEDDENEAGSFSLEERERLLETRQGDA